jgi:hypothetical protein
MYLQFKAWVDDYDVQKQLKKQVKLDEKQLSELNLLERYIFGIALLSANKYPLT